MKKRILLACSFLFATFAAQSSNIAIIDFSGNNAHLSNISNRILIQKCFSETDAPQFESGNVGSDSSIYRYYLYTRTSGCPEGGLNENRIGDREVIKYVRTNGIQGFSTLSSDHLSHVTHSAFNYSSQNVALISVAVYSSPSPFAVAPSNLEPVAPIGVLLDALDFVLENYTKYDIRVLNLSLGSDFHEGNDSCDNTFYGFEQTEIRNKINLLTDLGVAVVASAGNELPAGVEAGLLFPACISSVVSVGGFTVYDNRKILSGATSTAIDFVDEVYYTNTFNNNSIQGTSYAAPKIAGMISELMVISPSSSTNQIIQALFTTASSSGRIYYPTDPNKYDTGRLVANYQGAKGQIEDSYWKTRLIMPVPVAFWNQQV
jgi:hypothetical protein